MCLQLKTQVFTKRPPAREERGSQLVEFAILLPVVVMLLVGMFSMGRAYNVYQTLVRAAREGARQAVAPSCGSCGNAYVASGTITTTVKNALSVASLDPTKATINVTLPSSPPGFVTVQVSYPFKLLVPETSLNNTTWTITASVQMQQE